MQVKQKSELYEFFHGLAIAYGRTLDEKGPFVQAILEDLEAFCCADTTTHTPTRSDRDMFILEGRRQVWLRLKHFRTLNAQQLLDKYTRPLSAASNETTTDNRRKPR